MSSRLFRNGSGRRLKNKRTDNIQEHWKVDSRGLSRQSGRLETDLGLFINGAADELMETR